MKGPPRCRRDRGGLEQAHRVCREVLVALDLSHDEPGGRDGQQFLHDEDDRAALRSHEKKGISPHWERRHVVHCRRRVKTGRDDSGHIFVVGDVSVFVLGQIVQPDGQPGVQTGGEPPEPVKDVQAAADHSRPPRCLARRFRAASSKMTLVDGVAVGAREGRAGPEAGEQGTNREKDGARAERPIFYTPHDTRAARQHTRIRPYPAMIVKRLAGRGPGQPHSRQFCGSARATERSHPRRSLRNGVRRWRQPVFPGFDRRMRLPCGHLSEIVQNRGPDAVSRTARRWRR